MFSHSIGQSFAGMWARNPWNQAVGKTEIAPYSHKKGTSCEGACKIQIKWKS